jgi:hypothetical protein
MVLLLIALIWIMAKNATAQPMAINENLIQRFARGIATVEGFYVRNSRPARNHNPGNLTLDIQGGGAGIGKDGIYIKYASDADGWADLFSQVRMMFNNTSRRYHREMSIRDVAQRYTRTDQSAWARGVAGQLGVTIDTRLSELV